MYTYSQTYNAAAVGPQEVQRPSKRESWVPSNVETCRCHAAPSFLSDAVAVAVTLQALERWGEAVRVLEDLSCRRYAVVRGPA